MPKIDGYIHGTFELTEAGKTWTLTRGAAVRSDFFGISIEASATNTTLNIAGRINAGAAAIISHAETATINTTAGSLVIGAIAFEAHTMVLNLAGHLYGQPIDDVTTIFGQVTGRTAIRNDGVIEGYDGITLTAPDIEIVNGKAGIIGASATGLNLSGADSLSIVNRGYIYGTDAAIELFDPDGTIVNRGVIHGVIELGGGRTTFDNRRGTIEDHVRGGAGDDILITDDAGDRLFEEDGHGYDTVKSSVTYRLDQYVESLVLLGRMDIDGYGSDDDELLVGNRGNNVLYAYGGKDQVAGGRGDDTLYGGPGDDEFRFETGDGHDVIMDFDFTGDVIFMPRWNAIIDFEDLLENHIRMTGDDLVIHAGKDSLRIKAWGDREVLSDYFLIAE